LVAGDPSTEGCDGNLHLVFSAHCADCHI
jgi:hypothetical protein